MSTQSEIRECHQLMESELRRYPSGALHREQIEMLYALAARMQRLCIAETVDREEKGLMALANAQQAVYNALPI